MSLVLTPTTTPKRRKGDRREEDRRDPEAKAWPADTERRKGDRRKSERRVRIS